MNAARTLFYLFRLLIFIPFGILGSRPVAAIGLILAYVASVTTPGAHFDLFVRLGAGVACIFYVSRGIARMLHPGEMPERAPRQGKAPRAAKVPRVCVVAGHVSVPDLIAVTRRLSPALQATLKPPSVPAPGFQPSAPASRTDPLLAANG